jgi:hypothetical protein
MTLKATLDLCYRITYINYGKIQKKDQILIMGEGGLLSNPGVAKEFIKVFYLVYVIIMAQNRTEHRLAKAARA